MQNLIKAINSSVREEKSIVALQNCFHTWDGNMNADVLIGGIADRLTAMGQEAPAMRLRRVNLTEVVLEAPTGVILRVRAYRALKRWELASITGGVVGELKDGCYSVDYPPKYQELFSESELLVAGKWMLENVHHL